MAIVKMDRFSLIALERDREELIKRLQIFGDVQLRNLPAADDEELSRLTRTVSDARLNQIQTDFSNTEFCIKKLSKYTKSGGLKAMMAPLPSYSFEEFDNFVSGFDYSAIYERIKRADETIANAKSETLRIIQENEGLKSWIKLDADAQELESVHSVRPVFGSVSKTEADAFLRSAYEACPTAYLEPVADMKDDTVFLALIPRDIADDVSTAFRGLGFLRTSPPYREKPSDLLRANERRLAELKAGSEEAEAVYTELAKEYPSLKTASDCLRAMLERESSQASLLHSSSTVVIGGWCPSDETGAMEKVVRDVCGDVCHIEFEPVPHEDEEVPVRLRNKIFWPFEAIVEMFSIPKYSEIDPTPVTAPFYVLTAGLMLADTGFGLLVALVTGFALKFLTMPEGRRRFMALFFWIGCSTALCGLLFASFFGFSLGYTPIIDLENGGIQVMLILSIVIGVIQLMFGLCVKGYMLVRDGHPSYAVYDAGFVMIAVLSAIGFLLGGSIGLPAAFSSVCKWLLIGAAVGMVLTQGRDAVTTGGKLASGLYAVYGLSSYIGDSISFTRIAALMLSGSYIGMSFIKIADMFTGVSGFIARALIILVGQALNIGLGLLGAYVHTSRLQFVEYFGKFYEGGGVRYRPLSLKNKYTNIK